MPDEQASVDSLVKAPFAVDNAVIKQVDLLELSQVQGPVKRLVRRGYGQYCKDAYITNIIGKIMSGQNQCWMAYQLGETPRIIGMVLTEIKKIDALDATSLYINLLALEEGIHLTENAYTSCLVTLKKYAKDHGCDMLFAETVNLDLAQVAGKLGFHCFAAILRLDL